MKTIWCMMAALVLGVWSLGSIPVLADDTPTYRVGTRLLYREHQKAVELIPNGAKDRGDALPGSFDWGPLAQNPVGRSITNPVRDQGNCGSCWAFSSVAWMEAATNYLFGSAADLSEQVLVSDCCPAGDCDGGFLDEAADWLARVGTTTEACWPYTAADGPCSGYCPNPSVGRIGNWGYACGNWWTIDIAAIKNAIVTYGPLITAMDVYDDFMGYSGGVYRYTSGRYLGGHAILLTGYVDDPASPGGGFFIAKNSWGTGWGPYGGYFAVAYDSNCSFGIESTYYQGFIY